MRIICVFLLALLLVACGAPVRHHQILYHGRPVPHLFAYSTSELGRALKGLGLNEAFVGHLGRSGNGDQMLVFPFLASDGRIAALSLDGWAVVREAERPFGFCCKQQGFLAWYRGSKRMTADGDEIRSAAAFGKIAADPTGSFFFADVGENETAVASTHEPSTALYIAPFLGQAVFKRDGTVYLFGEDANWYRAHGTTRELICHVLTFEHERLNLLRDVRIPRPTEPVEVGSPFYVADMSPFSEEVLLVDARDMPLWDRWVLFDLATGKSAVIGRARGHALFLAGDILGVVSAGPHRYP